MLSGASFLFTARVLAVSYLFIKTSKLYNKCLPLYMNFYHSNKTIMKLRLGLLLLGVMLAISALKAQDVTTVEAKSSDISENLDLEAVASVFGEAKDLEDFEKRLNDPETQISNLDLNEDGEVDYLRVIEASEKGTHVITIQAVLGDDMFQDVATIDVEKGAQGETQVQVVGDVYMYGPNYIIEPVYVHPPVIWVWFWGPSYRPWRSPYYWGYYPPYYRPWHPYPPHRYRTNVHVHVNVNHTYRHTTVRRSKTSVQIQNKNRRNDYGRNNPQKSYDSRNKSTNKRAATPANNAKVNSRETPTSTGRKVNDDWKTQSERSGVKSNVKDSKVAVPTQKATQKPATNNASRPATNNAAKPASNRATKPASNNVNKPARNKAAKPAAPTKGTRKR